MEIEFWRQRWLEKQIGFHLDEVNAYLLKYWPALDLDKNSTVFVPLCGKSKDLLWLAEQGYHVIGVECSELAVSAFFNEHQLSYKVVDNQFHKHYISNSVNIELLHGDFFDMDKVLLDTVDAVFDRASLIALPADMRQLYVDKLADSLSTKTSILLITLEYDQNKMSGPPFSVSAEEVNALYASSFDIQLLAQHDVLDDQPRFKQRGLSYLVESVYLLKLK